MENKRATFGVTIGAICTVIGLVGMIYYGAKCFNKD